MEIKKTTHEDLEDVLALFAQAKTFMRNNGNPNQWDNQYPRKDLLQSDILLGHSFVCLSQGEVVGTFCFYLGNDPTYHEIQQGQWLNSLPYGVIHRIASGTAQRGVGTYCINYCKNICQNIRIDTHNDNHVMQAFLTKHDFTYCGTIHLDNGDPRMAYHFHSSHKME